MAVRRCGSTSRSDCIKINYQRIRKLKKKKTHLLLETYASRALICPPSSPLLLLPLSNSGGRDPFASLMSRLLLLSSLCLVDVHTNFQKVT